MSNPFKGKVRVDVTLLDEPPLPLMIDDGLLVESFAAEISHVQIQPPQPSAWQRVMGVVFGEGITPLPPAPVNSDTRISKRRLRRLRGRAKAA